MNELDVGSHRVWIHVETRQGSYALRDVAWFCSQWCVPETYNRYRSVTPAYNWQGHTFPPSYKWEPHWLAANLLVPYPGPGTGWRCRWGLEQFQHCIPSTHVHLQYSSGKRTKKLFIPNIGISRTCQKHSESNRVNVIFGGHHSQVRRMYALCEVTRNGNIIPRRQHFSRSDAKFLGVIWLNTCPIFIYLFIYLIKLFRYFFNKNIFYLFLCLFFHHIVQSAWRLYCPRSCGCAGWSECALITKVLLSQKCFPNFRIPIPQN